MTRPCGGPPAVFVTARAVGRGMQRCTARAARARPPAASFAGGPSAPWPAGGSAHGSASEDDGRGEGGRPLGPPRQSHLVGRNPRVAAETGRQRDRRAGEARLDRWPDLLSPPLPHLPRPALSRLPPPSPSPSLAPPSSPSSLPPLPPRCRHRRVWPRAGRRKRIMITPLAAESLPHSFLAPWKLAARCPTQGHVHAFLSL